MPGCGRGFEGSDPSFSFLTGAAVYPPQFWRKRSTLLYECVFQASACYWDVDKTKQKNRHRRKKCYYRSDESRWCANTWFSEFSEFSIHEFHEKHRKPTSSRAWLKHKKNRIKSSRVTLVYVLKRECVFTYGHTIVRAPHPVWSAKLSTFWPG